MLTQSQLKQRMSYDPDTGVFTRISSPRFKGAYEGQEVGYVRKDSIVIVSVDSVQYTAHRLAWLYMTGEWPESQIDHIDRDCSNNRWANLRGATAKQNMFNQSVMTKNTSGAKGVSVYYNVDGTPKYMVRIRLNGKAKNIGTF